MMCYALSYYWLNCYIGYVLDTQSLHQTIGKNIKDNKGKKCTDFDIKGQLIFKFHLVQILTFIRIKL